MENMEAQFEQLKLLLEQSQDHVQVVNDLYDFANSRQVGAQYALESIQLILDDKHSHNQFELLKKFEFIILFRWNEIIKKKSLVEKTANLIQSFTFLYKNLAQYERMTILINLPMAQYRSMPKSWQLAISTKLWYGVWSVHNFHVDNGTECTILRDWLEYNHKIGRKFNKLESKKLILSQLEKSKAFLTTAALAKEIQIDENILRLQIPYNYKVRYNKWLEGVDIEFIMRQWEYAIANEQVEIFLQAWQQLKLIYRRLKVEDQRNALSYIRVGGTSKYNWIYSAMPEAELYDLVQLIKKDKNPPFISSFIYYTITNEKKDSVVLYYTDFKKIVLELQNMPDATMFKFLPCMVRNYAQKVCVRSWQETSREAQLKLLKRASYLFKHLTLPVCNEFECESQAKAVQSYIAFQQGLLPKAKDLLLLALQIQPTLEVTKIFGVEDKSIIPDYFQDFYLQTKMDLH